MCTCVVKQKQMKQTGNQVWFIFWNLQLSVIKPPRDTKQTIKLMNLHPTASENESILDSSAMFLTPPSSCIVWELYTVLYKAQSAAVSTITTGNKSLSFHIYFVFASYLYFICFTLFCVAVHYHVLLWFTIQI